MAKTHNQKQFNYVNIISSIPLMINAFLGKLIPNALLSLAFGIIGCYGVFKETKKIHTTSPAKNF